MAINKSKVMDAGRKAYQKGQYDKAIKEYSKIVKEDPKDVRVWLKIGDLYAKKNAKIEATETYLKVATYYSEQGFYLKAVAVYRQILKVDPRLVEINLKLAELYRQLGLLSEATQHFETVAVFFHREGKIQEAMATLRQLVELDSENVATRIKLAELYSKENMIKEAIAEFTITCEFLRNNGRQDDFIKVAERLVFHEPDNIAICKELAVAYLKRNDPRRALAKLQICFKADKGDANVLALLAQAFQRLDQRGKTVSVLKELARVHAQSGKRNAAAEVHEKILIYVPNDIDSLQFLGRTVEPAPAPAPAPAPIAVPVEVPQSHSVNLNMPTHGHSNAQGRPSSLEIDSQGTYQHVEEGLNSQESADDIVKILTETDVYVKFGLHDKAIDHLRKVFVLDERNVEARERLQEVLLKEGRESEALRELLVLAEHTVGQSSEQALGYLRQMLAIDSGSRYAQEFAERHCLQIELNTNTPFAQPSDELVELAEEDFEEVDLEFDDIVEVAPDIASDTYVVPTDSVQGYPAEEPMMENDFQNSGGSIDVDVDAAYADSVNLSFDEDPLLGPEEPLSPPGPSDDLAFDAVDAAAFDSQQGYQMDGPTNPESKPIALDFVDEASQESFEEEVFELDSSQYELSDLDIVDEDHVQPHSEMQVESSSLEDILEKADSFILMMDWSQARAVLEPLLVTNPNNMLILSKLEEVEAGAQSAGDFSQNMPSTETDVSYQEPLHDFDDSNFEASLGDMLDDGLDSPSVVLENPIADDDAATHFDLGQAYKEMGIYNEAISAFEKVLSAPGREVQCRLMIGLCFREQGSLSEAISQFKAGLYVGEISGSEKFGLYYEIGVTYEGLQDPQEALYYYEMVLKKDASYRDVSERIAAIKSNLTG